MIKKRNVFIINSAQFKYPLATPLATCHSLFTGFKSPNHQIIHSPPIITIQPTKSAVKMIIDTFASINVFQLELKQIEKISKALADTNRLEILQNMSERKGCIQCSEIMAMTKLAQPSVSHHVKTLIEAGLIEAEKDGRNYSYQLNKNLLTEYLTWVNKIIEK
jgi:ArsR family transcriptional regulator